jgi:hypothetical protein
MMTPMAKTIILVQVRIHELDRLAVTRYHETVERTLAPVPGYVGSSFWRDADDASSNLILFEYEDIESADAGLIAVAKQQTLVEGQSVGAEPANVIRAHIQAQTGKGIADAPGLSLSIRVSEPGYGVELAEELERIFQELTVLNGFLGGIVAINDSLDEEIIGIAGWRSREEFGTSLPAGSLYEVRYFIRSI